MILDDNGDLDKPFGYCSVATIGSSKTLKALSNLLDTSTICGKYWMLLLNFSCKSHRNKQVFWGTSLPNLGTVARADDMFEEDEGA